MDQIETYRVEISFVFHSWLLGFEWDRQKWEDNVRWELRTNQILGELMWTIYFPVVTRG